MSKRPPSELGADEEANGEAKVPRLDTTTDGNGLAAADDAAAAAAAPVEAVGTIKQQLGEAPESRPLPRDIPTIQYREGRLGKEFNQHWFTGRDQLLVVIPPECMVGSNKMVKSRQLWGEGIYTDDSDLVAVLLHLGYLPSNSTAHHPLVARFYAHVQLLDVRDAYPSCFRNAVRSRAWFSKVDVCSYKVLRCWLVTRSNRLLELQPRVDDCAITHPTFALSISDRQMATRSASGSSRNRPVTEVTLMYNLCNEPWLKYCMSTIADRGLKSSQWTSSRLRSDALYLETSRERYELTYSGGAAGEAGTETDTYTFSRCRTLWPVAALRVLGVPLAPEQVEVVEEGLSWDDIQWSNMLVTLRGKQYRMLRMQFMPRRKGTAPGASEDDVKAALAEAAEEAAREAREAAARQAAARQAAAAAKEEQEQDDGAGGSGADADAAADGNGAADMDTEGAGADAEEEDAAAS